MTIHEMYDKNIKGLPVADRLRLARLILDDAAPDDPMTQAQADERYAQLIDEACASGSATPLTKGDFDDLRQALRDRSARRNSPSHA